MTIVEQLIRERDEYRKAYLNYLGLYNRVIELYVVYNNRKVPQIIIEK